jgi:nuclear transport factor 2 (NTF2) superfamily protein
MAFFLFYLLSDKLFDKHQVDHKGNPRLIKLDFISSTHEKARTLFHYNDKGLMHHALWSCDDNRSENIYRYNEKDQMISAYREFSNGLTSYENFLYDDMGRKIHETFLRSDGLKGTADYFYDNTGRCDHVVCDHYKGWINGKIVYDHDKEGPSKRAVILQDKEIIGEIIFEYDQQNKLIKDTWTYTSGFTQAFIYHYEKR